MTRVKFTGWEHGVKSVGLTRFISSKTSLTLTQSREAVDKLLAGDPVVIDFAELSTEDVRLLSTLKVEFSLMP